MTKNENESNKNGLPDISISIKYKKILIVSILAIVVVIMVNKLFFRTNSQQKTSIQQAEEIYTVPLSHSIDNSISQTTDTSEAKEVASVNPEVMQQQLAILQEKQKELQQRLSAPLMLVNTGHADVVNDTGQVKKISNDENTQFMNTVSAQASESVNAKSIGSLNSVIAEGTLIHATLESSTNSDLPGMLRASVSEAVYSEDGSRILIPQGSRLIGQYKSGISQGQSRFFIVWTRLITPEGFSIQLGSPGIDNLGVAGMGADEINRHFWERFGSASLLSLIGAGVANLGMNGQDQNNPALMYREAVATSFAQSASQSLQHDIHIAPTLKTHQGKSIMVFVAKDLHFENAMKSVKPKLNVF